MKTLFILCFCTSLIFSLSSCSEKTEELTPMEATDDAALLASQLKLLQTRATDATNTILISTAKSVDFKVEHNSPIIVEWGDGNNNIDVFTHTYTDDLPVHTIRFNGAKDAITTIEALGQELIFLDVTQDTTLTILNCSNNKISQINLSQKIQTLHCAYNNLKLLNISNLKSLLELQCYNNNLTKLDVSNNINLNILTCSDNTLDSININFNPELTYLSCTNCNLYKLDVSNNIHLERLECASNQLNGTLDLTSLQKLKYLMCMHNKLDSIRISPDNKNLLELWCYNNNLTSLNLPGQTPVETIFCQNNRLKKLILPHCPNLFQIYCYNNDFEQDFTQLLIFVSSLPYKNPENFSIISLSINCPYLPEITPIIESKNWFLTTL